MDTRAEQQDRVTASSQNEMTERKSKVQGWRQHIDRICYKRMRPTPARHTTHHKAKEMQTQSATNPLHLAQTPQKRTDLAEDCSILPRLSEAETKQTNNSIKIARMPTRKDASKELECHLCVSWRARQRPTAGFAPATGKTQALFLELSIR